MRKFLFFSHQIDLLMKNMFSNIAWKHYTAKHKTRVNMGCIPNIIYKYFRFVVDKESVHIPLLILYQFMIIIMHA